MVKFTSGMAQIREDQWQGLWASDYPFTQYAFLNALETTGCVCAESGWQPSHAIIETEGCLSAAAPLYLKDHSYGEYVFDWAWADAYVQAGFDYYPKLVCAIPFTPATGPRITAATPELAQTLMQSLEQEAQSVGSGIHLLFPDAALTAQLHSPHWHERWGCQFHWFNRGFADFEDFIGTFSSRKRKNLMRERRKIIEQNITVECVPGEQLTEQDWHTFYGLYCTTYIKRSGHTGYLNRAFFLAIGRTLAQQVMMVKASSQGETVAAALYFYDSTTLYGRYWGAVQEFDALHFECCYYQGIEFAIGRGLQRFDPGAQGEHKIQRGFTPVLTRSLHYLSHPGFNRGVAQYLNAEQKSVLQYCHELRDSLPFKEGSERIDPFILLNASAGLDG